MDPTTATLEQSAQRELQDWQDLSARAEAVFARLLELDARRVELLARAEAVPEFVTAAVAGVSGALDEAREQFAALQNSADELEQTPAAIEAAFDAGAEALDEALSVVESARDDFSAQLETESEALRDAVTERLESEVEELKDAAEHYVETTRQAAETGLDNVVAAYDGLSEKVTADAEAAIAHVKERVEELADMLDEKFECWTSGVDEVKNAFAGIGTEIDGLGADVTRLTETVSTALELTGGGMTVATRGMQDVQSVLSDVA